MGRVNNLWRKRRLMEEKQRYFIFFIKTELDVKKGIKKKIVKDRRLWKI